MLRRPQMGASLLSGLILSFNASFSAVQADALAISVTTIPTYRTHRDVDSLGSPGHGVKNGDND